MSTRRVRDAKAMLTLQLFGFEYCILREIQRTFPRAKQSYRQLSARRSELRVAETTDTACDLMALMRQTRSGKLLQHLERALTILYRPSSPEVLGRKRTASPHSHSPLALCAYLHFGTIGGGVQPTIPKYRSGANLDLPKIHRLTAYVS